MFELHNIKRCREYVFIFDISFSIAFNSWCHLGTAMDLHRKWDATDVELLFFLSLHVFVIMRWHRDSIKRRCVSFAAICLRLVRSCYATGQYVQTDGNVKCLQNRIHCTFCSYAHMSWCGSTIYCCCFAPCLSCRRKCVLRSALAITLVMLMNTDSHRHSTCMHTL